MKIRESHRYRQDDEERGEHGTDGRRDAAFQPANLVPRENRDVDREKSWSGLGQCDYVREFLAIYPLSLLHLILYKRYHGIAASDGECSDFHEN